MTVEDNLSDAIQAVSGWDLEPEDFAQAVNEQARLMAGLPIEYTPPSALPSAYLALQFSPQPLPLPS